MAIATEVISVSFTQFIRYATKPPEQQLTVVRQIRQQHESGYDVPPDCYKQFREAVVKLLKEKRPKEYLDHVANSQEEASRAKHYPILAAGFKSFLGRKQYTWIEPPTGYWKPDGLKIRVRPEIGLRFGGSDYFIKLWLNDENDVNKRRASLLTHLMGLALGGNDAGRLAILDVRRGKLFEHEGNDPQQFALLRSQAASFVSLYRNL